MRHTFLVVTVKRWSKSVYIYGSYRKIKTGVPLFWTTRYIVTLWDHVTSSVTEYSSVKRPTSGDNLTPSKSTWTARPPVGCSRLHPPSPFITIIQPESHGSILPSPARSSSTTVLSFVAINQAVLLKVTKQSTTTSRLLPASVLRVVRAFIAGP